MTTRQERYLTLEQGPLARTRAWPAVARCARASALLLTGGHVRLTKGRLGRRLRFADGTSALVYRETRLDGGTAFDPCALVVAFRLRGVHGRGHMLFRWESLLNTPLFVGFPGFRSKLWLTADEHGSYRGVYEWDGAERAEHYARSLWRVLALVSVPGSIRYTVRPGVHRDDLIRLAPRAGAADPDGWWRPVGGP
ncbi:hypothetical protein DN069_04670 [Streptacidiphilus pinicola]|uniref:Uncharacterized protein n=1 Tax=Streptacidiphilus pinicola TaxID=2219663 RepID=A0A2X0KJD0_9ACTN|nr:hypothetical protein [Streptacidiphilus pinicola]RAG86830.1 hypothetical protein DN069_04670 [Streptacidiphilus pinicola]